MHVIMTICKLPEFCLETISANDLIFNVNVLHWIVRHYYYGFLVNKDVCLIFVIQTFYPSALSVLYSDDVYPTCSRI